MSTKPVDQPTAPVGQSTTPADHAAELEHLFAGLDGERPLPSELRDRLHATLAPGAMPHLLRRRLERVLVRRSAQRWLPAAAAAAAVIAVLIGAVAFQDGDPTTPALQEVVIESTTTSSTAPSVPVAALPSERPASAAAGAAGAPTETTTKTAESSVAATAGGGGTRMPPFATTSDDQTGTGRQSTTAAPPADASPDGAGAGESSSSTGSAVKVGVVGGDAGQERGFRAYMAVANDAGGLGDGRPIELVAATSTTPAPGSVLTVNLSGQALAGWKGGPLVETLNVTEASLKGEVFGLAGPAERQAHLVVDAVIPFSAPATTAVIYTGGSGAWSEVVPAAYEEALRARGVASIRVAVEPGRPTPFQVADAAFLALDPAHLAAFADEVKTASYQPKLGIAGTWSAFDPTLAGKLPDGSKVITPWQPASGHEANVMLQRAGAPVTGSVLHGWAVAKSVAVALSKNPSADSASEVTEALGDLAGYSPLLAPAYEFRKGTRSRTPEGRLYELSSAGFTARSEWRKDTF